MSSKKSEKRKSQNNQSSDLSLGFDVVLPENRIRILESEKKALEIQLVNRSEMMTNLKMECDSVRQSLQEMNKKHDEEKRRSQVVIKDMTRQYKGMQDDLLNKINDRERMIQDLTDSMYELKMSSQRIIDEKDCTIREKRNEILQIKKRMDEMCRDFASMLETCRKKMMEIDVMTPFHSESLEYRMHALSFLLNNEHPKNVLP